MDVAAVVDVGESNAALLSSAAKTSRELVLKRERGRADCVPVRESL